MQSIPSRRAGIPGFACATAKNKPEKKFALTREKQTKTPKKNKNTPQKTPKKHQKTHKKKKFALTRENTPPPKKIRAYARKNNHFLVPPQVGQKRRNSFSAVSTAHYRGLWLGLVTRFCWCTVRTAAGDGGFQRKTLRHERRSPGGSGGRRLRRFPAPSTPRLAVYYDEAATNATSHGRRSFLVVMAASWRSRQRPSPLRGGHGGGLCPFVVVTAEVFYTSTQKQRKKSLHMRLPPFSSQEPAWGLRLFAALAPPGEFFGEIIEKKRKKPKKATSTGRGRWSCGGLRRAALEVTAVFCGHGRWFILEVFLGFSIWRLKRHNPSFALVAATRRFCFHTYIPMLVVIVGLDLAGTINTVISD